MIALNVLNIVWIILMLLVIIWPILVIRSVAKDTGTSATCYTVIALISFLGVLGIAFNVAGYLGAFEDTPRQLIYTFYSLCAGLPIVLAIVALSLHDDAIAERKARQKIDEIGKRVGCWDIDPGKNDIAQTIHNLEEKLENVNKKISELWPTGTPSDEEVEEATSAPTL